MPALRKRKSRTGTPLTTPADTPTHGSDLRKEKHQSSLDAWVEPAPQNLGPSFEEHGFARHGVLENMAPLGVPPSTKVKQKARGIGETAVRRATFGRKSNAFVGEEEGTTPETTPAPELDREDSERQDEDEMQTAFPDEEEDEDDDYMPTKKKQKTAHGLKTPVRGKSATQGKASAHGKTPVKNGFGKSPSAFVSPVTQGPGLHDLDQATQQRIQIAVNDAVSRSNKLERRNVGQALQQMLKGSREDPKLARSLDGVIHQKETAEDWGVFRKFIKQAKKEIKRQHRIQQAEEAAKAAKEAKATSAFTDQPQVSSPTAESEIGPNDSASATFDTEPPAAITTESSKTIGLAAEDAILSPESPHPEGAAVTPHPLTTAPSFSAAEDSTPPAHKRESRSPKKQHMTNGNLAQETELDMAAEPSTTAPTPAARTPKAGAGSDSDLSEVDEDILQNEPPPPPLQVNGNGVTTLTKKARIAALARAGKKSRANSAKPFGKHKEKSQPTPEELAEQAEVQTVRQQFNDRQQGLREEMRGYAPTSDLRFDDEYLETESLTESQIAVGPPVDANRPRRAGRAPPRNGIAVLTGGAKRPREDSRFSSPRLESATTSRPSTPAFSHVPSKRVKLNNGQSHQAARTKKS